MAFWNGKMPFMNATVEIDKAGRLVVEKKMRDALHLVPGTRLTLRQEGASIVIRPDAVSRGLRWKNGVPVFEFGRPLPPGHDDWVERARDERSNELMGPWTKS
jgi:bifunctional DNA-binding transcriptional regulator/antitoxin component of YhaV-PrlF toxin-antitoxin module